MLISIGNKREAKTCQATLLSCNNTIGVFKLRIETFTVKAAPVIGTRKLDIEKFLLKHFCVILNLLVKRILFCQRGFYHSDLAILPILFVLL